MKYVKGRGFLPEEGDTTGLFDEDRPCDLTPPVHAPAVTYYFSAAGSDENDGLSPERPKRTLAEAARLVRRGGVCAAFRGGDVFEGGLCIETQRPLPVLVCGYGKGMPVFRGGEAVIRVHSSHVTLRGLEVTDPQALRGIFVCPHRAGALTDVAVEDCYVHDVNFFWDSSVPPAQTDPDEVDVERVCPEYYPGTRTYWRYNRRSHGGIIFLNETEQETGASWFENIYILRNRVENVARTGIYLANVWADSPGVGYGRNTFVREGAGRVDAARGLGYFPHENVVCSDNAVICAGGDGAVLSSVRHAFMERNVCMYANYLGRENYWNAGLWVFDAHEVWMRANESGCTYMRHGSNDAQGFDIDNACTKVVFKNNYAHHNEGGGLLLCNKPTQITLHGEDGEPLSEETLMGRWYDNLVCCNVFEENGNPRDETRAAFLTIAREVDYLFAYSNLVLMRAEGRGQSLIHTEDESMACYRHYYLSNVFACVRPVRARLTAGMLREGVFDQNAFVRVGEEIIRSSGDAHAKRTAKNALPKARGRAVRTLSVGAFRKIIMKRGSDK